MPRRHRPIAGAAVSPRAEPGLQPALRAAGPGGALGAVGVSFFGWLGCLYFYIYFYIFLRFVAEVPCKI